jgi:hypothetical protein
MVILEILVLLEQQALTVRMVILEILALLEL